MKSGALACIHYSHGAGMRAESLNRVPWCRTGVALFTGQAILSSTCRTRFTCFLRHTDTT